MTTTFKWDEERVAEIRKRNERVDHLRWELQSQLREVVSNFKGIVSLEGFEDELVQVFDEVKNDNEAYPFKGVDEIF